MTSLPHDGSYKHLFSYPEMVESLIRDFVPEDWVRELNFSSLERCNGSYVSRNVKNFITMVYLIAAPIQVVVAP